MFVATKATPAENSSHWRVVLLHDRNLPYWRARLLPSRNFGKSAIRQIGRSVCRQKNFSAHKDVRPPERKFFPLTGGRGSCRAVISAGRQVGSSADRQIGKSGFRQKNFGSPNVRPPKSRTFVAVKVAPTVNFVFRAKLFRRLRRVALRSTLLFNTT